MVMCGDNRFEIIEAAKKHLIDATNIETSPDEMAVLDNILFRMWQMDWLPIHAHWIKAFFPGSVECGLPILIDATCSHCDFKMEELYSYCPNCGAIMDEVVE